MNQNTTMKSFLPEGNNRQGEGGLRIKGYFKQSYEEKPLITIITVVYNGEKYLEETIQSVINQTYDNVEYIIIDGGSTDGTVDIIKKYEDKIDYWVSEKDNGIYDAWNKGIILSQGEWIGFLGADDFYLPNALKEFLSIIIATHDIEYISARNILCTENKKPLRTIGSAWNWETFYSYMNVAHVGSLHHISIFRKYGLYSTEFKICSDYEFLLRPRNFLKAAFLNQITCYMRFDGISNSSIKPIYETCDIKIKHGRNIFLSKLEMLIVIMKWYIRKKIKF